MRDYSAISKRLRRYSENCVAYKLDADFANAVTAAADAIEELVARASENDWRVCKNCQLQHFDTDGKRWCEELSIVVGDNFYCGFFEGSEPPKGVE